MNLPEKLEGEFKVGDKVYTGVFVCGEWRRMASGIITKVGGCYEVDVMSLHGGAPWLTYHTHIEHFTESKEALKGQQ